MANDFEFRLNTLESDFSKLREYVPILYGFIDELRANSLKLDRQHDEMLKRMEQNEFALNEFRIRSEERMAQNEKMIASLVSTQENLVSNQGKFLSTQDNLVLTQNTLVETQGMILQLIDRIDQRLDNLGNPSKNGHS